MSSPLSLMVIRYGPPADSEPFVGALRKAFLGVETGQSYTASDYELLDPLDFRVFTCPTRKERSVAEVDAIKEGVAAASEAVLVVLLLALDDDVAAELVLDWARFAAGSPHRFVLAVSLATPHAPALPAERGDEMAALGLDALNERDLRRDLLALHALNRALHLFSRTAGNVASPGVAGARPKLFISHAKRDGVPLARSIRAWIKDMGAVEFFYDTDNLDLAGDISAQLEQAVSGSILVVLRTEVFDQRYWCQKEIYWAEKHGVPFLAVDGRWSLQHAASVIVFDGSPSVRIPDGSIMRILLAAMMEALRVAFFRARVRQTARDRGLTPERWCSVPRFPSLGSLHSATEGLAVSHSAAASGVSSYILYPNPALPDELRRVAAEMAAARLPGCRVLSLDELRTLRSPLS